MEEGSREDQVLVEVAYRMAGRAELVKVPVRRAETLAHGTLLAEAKAAAEHRWTPTPEASGLTRVMPPIHPLQQVELGRGAQEQEVPAHR